MARKRGQNEGTIFQRRNGTWRAQITLDGRRVSHSAKTRRECNEWLKKIQGQIDDGMTFESTKISFRDFSIRWLASKKTNLNSNTWSQYDHLLNKYVLPYFSNIKIRELRTEHIQRLYDDMLDQGVGTWTVLKTHNIVQGILAHAIKTGLIIQNPASQTILPKEPNSEMKILDERQLSQFLVAAGENRLKALYNLAVTTGMRQSELLGLLWTDLDWINQFIRVERQLIRPKGSEVEFAPPKTKFGKRTIALGDESLKILRNHYEEQHDEQKREGDRWIDNGLIFTTSIGTPIHARNLLRDFKKLLNSAGLPEIRFHDLRHTAASIMLNHGIPVIIVSRRLGHARPSITLDVYGHLIPSMDEDASQKIDNIVTPLEVDRLHQVAPEIASNLTPNIPITQV